MSVIGPASPPHAGGPGPSAGPGMGPPFSVLIMNTKKLTRYIGIAMVLGIVVGYFCNNHAQNPQEAAQIASYFSLITDIFLRMIKMIIAPLVFATLVTGLASMSDASAVGRIGMRAMIWFIAASAISLLLGLALVNLFQPGAHLNMALPDAGATSGLKTGDFTLKAFIAHVFPRSIAEAMATNEILQILVFSLFFGAALSFIRGKGHDTLYNMIDELAKIMFRVTDYVMRFAPLGVFAAMAAAITTEGLGVLVSYGKLIGEFYLGLALLWAVLFSVGYLFLGKSAIRLGGLIKEPTLLAFSTASSESAYPKTIEALTRFGVPKRISGFVLPLGYSFNLDGSMMYQSFAVLFIAQAYNIEMSFTQQLTLLLVLMVTSKGMAGVARASLVVVAATLPMFHLPEAGLLLIMGIDQFFDMGRTATNVVGNSLATAVISKLEGKQEAPGAQAASSTQDEPPAVQPASQRA
jgi:Na+/H+-dicarboxylate symporter